MFLRNLIGKEECSENKPFSEHSNIEKVVTSLPKELAQADPLHDFKAKQ